MSAFIVDPGLVDRLVSFAVYSFPELGLDPDTLGAELMSECVKSVRYRYPDDEAHNLPGPRDQSRVFDYSFTSPSDWTLESILSDCKEYEYQSCEHPEYEGSQARAWIVLIQRTAEAMTPTPKPVAVPVPVVHVSLDDTLKQLRAELKREFPGTKFSIRRSRGTAYGWVSVDWTDGPTYDEVNGITSMYQGSGFDGMTDSSYTIEQTSADKDGNVVRVQYGTRGINCSRDISAALANKLIAVVVAYWGGIESFPTAIEGYLGYRLEEGRQNIRPDLDLDWYTAIHRASNGLYDREEA